MSTTLLRELLGLPVTARTLMFNNVVGLILVVGMWISLFLDPTVWGWLAVSAITWLGVMVIDLLRYRRAQ